MKTMPKPTLLALAAAFALAVISAACAPGGGQSNATSAQYHQGSGQRQLLTVGDWRAIAVEVAARIHKAISDRDDLTDQPIYLAPPHDRPFAVAFYNLLRTELVSRGLQVSYQREPHSTLVEYTAQTVLLNDERDYTLVVNARMYFLNRFVMHCSLARYIKDEDIALYADPQLPDPYAVSTERIKISRK